VAQVAVVEHGRVGDGGESSSTIRVTLNDALKSGSSQHGTPAGVGGFELRGGDDPLGAVRVLERAAVEAVELVVEDAGKGETQGVVTGAPPSPPA